MVLQKREQQDLDLTFGLLFLKVVLEIIARGRSLVVAQRWITAVFLAMFRPFCMGVVNLFTSISASGIVCRSSVSAIKRSPVQLLSASKAYPMNIPGKLFVPSFCTRPLFLADMR